MKGRIDLGNDIRCKVQLVLKDFPPWYKTENMRQMNGWLGCYIYDEHWSVDGDKNQSYFSLELFNDSELMKAKFPDSAAMITINGDYSKSVDVGVFRKIVEGLRPYVNTADTKELTGNVIGWCEDEDGYKANNFTVYLDEALRDEYTAQVPVYCRECKNRSVTKEKPCANNENCERIYYLGLNHHVNP